MSEQLAVSPPESLVRITHVIYALYAASVFVGITALIALVLDYIYRPDAAATWLESHFRWQIRTFWFSTVWGLLLIAAMIAVVFAFLFGAAAPLALGTSPANIAAAALSAFLAAPVVALLLLAALLVLSVWVTYRIMRGWMALGSRQALPV